MVVFMKILFAGCGDIAMRTTKYLPAHDELWGLRRSVEKLTGVFKPLKADLSNQAMLKSILPDTLDYIVVTLTPNGRTEEAYQKAYVETSQCLLEALKHRAVKHVFYISSTSVYPQTGHEWLDETSTTTELGTGARLKQAEDIWLRSDIGATVLRLSGIYGADRRFFLKQIERGATAPEGLHYTNRIHVEDAARAIAYLIGHHKLGNTLSDTYIVTDNTPAPLVDVAAWLAGKVDIQASDEPLELGRRGGSKRCSNKRLLATGFKCNYPSYKQGYQAILDSGC